MIKFNNRPSFYLGNFLIVFGLALIAYIYLPFLMLFLNPPKIEATENLEGFYITIPKIKAQAPIIEDVDPWNPAIYQKALENGVAHAKETSLPGQKGTIFLFAHSSDSPWRITRYNTIFLRLGELENNDELVINRDKKTYKYKVFEKREVYPSEIKYLKETEKDQLILQTCTPIGTAFKRLLIFAKPF